MSVLCWRRKLGRVELARIQHALAETLENSQDQLLRVPLRSLRPSLDEMDVPMVRTVGRPPPVQTGESDRLQDIIVIGEPTGRFSHQTRTLLIYCGSSKPALVATDQSDAREGHDLLDRRPRPTRGRPRMLVQELATELRTPFVQFHTKVEVAD